MLGNLFNAATVWCRVQTGGFCHGKKWGDGSALSLLQCWLDFAPITGGRREKGINKSNSIIIIIPSQWSWHAETEGGRSCLNSARKTSSGADFTQRYYVPIHHGVFCLLRFWTVHIADISWSELHKVQQLSFCKALTHSQLFYSEIPLRLDFFFFLKPFQN